MTFAGWGGRLAPALLATTWLAGCDDSPPPPPPNFPALHYDYLTPIRLNVADVEVEDQSTPPDGDLASRSPVRPAAAMEQMAHDRLIAAGAAGTATFVVTEASITRTDNGVTEHLAARLEISNASGGHAGFAEAHVTRTETPGNGEPVGPASLYELTRQAMEDMNVEFEYQVRHTLHDWLITNGAVEAPVEQAPLGAGAPGAAGAPLPLAPAGPAAPLSPPGYAPGAPTRLAPPPPAASAASPGAMSPPPGYLEAPPGVAPANGAPAYGAPGSPAPGYPAPGYPASGYAVPSYPGSGYPGSSSPESGYPGSAYPPAPYGASAPPASPNAQPASPPSPYGNVPASSQAYPGTAPPQSPTGY